MVFRTSDFGREMILRLIGLLLGAAALVLGLSFGWGWQLGAALGRVNPGAMGRLQDGVQRSISQMLWDSLVSPVLSMPAWSALAAIALLLFVIAAMRPGRG
ncbi:MAG TPA: hypothetical protein VN329_08420 [Roseomonas sp.]|nr:hypothetical protein [Roseomonas sp.]